VFWGCFTEGEGGGGGDPSAGEGAVAVGVPQDDEPVLRDDKFI